MKPSRFLAALGLALAFAAGAQTAEPTVRIKSVGTAVLGRADAPVTMIEFSDYECTFCQQYHAVAFEAIKRDFIDSGKLRYVVRDFPLPTHRQAIVAARAVRCAGEQGRYWEMRSTVFKTTDLLDTDMLVELGRGLKLDEASLRACITSERHDAGIRKDMADAAAAGVNATPSFVLGRSVGEGVTGKRFAGAQPYAAYAERINALLEEPGTREGPAPGSAPR